MTKKLTITLNEEATENYLNISSNHVEAEVNEDCLPSGLDILITISPPFGSTAFMGSTELGAAKIELIEND